MELNNITYRLEQLVYYPTRTQNPVMLRPYVFNVDYGVVDAIGQRINETAQGRITPGMLGGLASGIVQPSTVGYDGALNASWVSTARYLFMLKVVYVDHVGSEINAYIFGYTEYDGMSQSGAIDTGMMHYINNVIETTVYHISTPLGVKRVEKLYNVYNAIYSTSNLDIYTQRPMDLHETMKANNLASILPEDMQISNSSNLITPFTNNVVSSNTDNGITTSYLAAILTGGIQAVKSQEIHIPSYGIGGSNAVMNDDPGEKFFNEPHVTDNQFLRQLSRMAGSRVTNPFFKFSSLMQVDPTIYDRCQLFNITNDFASPILNRTPEVGDTWHGQDMVTVKAFSLMENAVSMATKYGFTKLSFIASNMADPSGITISILDFNSFLSLSQQDFNYLLGIFEDRFRSDIFLSETNGGKVGMHLECHINLMGTSKIYLEYAGFPGNWFTVPTYASSLYSSVVSTDKNTVEYSAGQLSNALNILADAHQPMQY